MMGVLLASSLLAQVDLTEVKRKIDNEIYSQAISDLNGFLAQEPKNPELHYWKGVSLFQSGAVEDAKAAFLAGIKAKGKYPYNHVGLGRVQFAEEDATMADESIKKALNYDKGKDINVRFAAADAYLEGKKVKDAEVLLYQAQEDAPDNPQSYIMLGGLYEAKGTGVLALSQYEKAIQKDPNFVKGHTAIGELKIEGEEYDAGAASLRKAMEIDPNYAPAYRAMGELWFKARNYEKARDFYQKYVSLTQDDIAARLRYAQFLFLSENYSETISEFNNIQEDTINSVMRRLAGMAYYKTGDLASGKKWMDEYFANIDPKYTIFQDYETYGRIMLESGDRDKADEYFAKAIDKDFQKITLFETVAKEYKAEARKLRAEARKSKDEATSQKAIEASLNEAHFYTQYMDRVPQKSTKHFQTLGMAYYNAKSYENALENFNILSEMAPGNSTIARLQFAAAGNLDRAAKAENPDAISWIAKDPAQQIVEILGEKDPATMKKADLGALKAALTLLAYYKFDPEAKQENNCDAAEFFVKKGLELDPESPELKNIDEYCTAVKAQEGQ